MRVDEQDPAFRMTDGIVVVSRAAIEIDKDCSVDLSQVLIEAMNRGLIRAVAYVHKNDYLADQLRR